ncbi:hypothetical protein VTL71DRAFT_5529 [Oculimacula yallundae]|uniref:STB6-like N-terminal domain-containing protein n=1 Tax=Oculimacula yallundae TaxID=86028 RepID=A0ABR4C308_9HELO
MSSRFSFPNVYDPQMHREEVLTLSRTTSQQKARTLANTNANGTPGSPMTRHPPSSNRNPPHSILRRNIVFTDPVAFRYLEEDPLAVVIERRGKIVGYELYIVEQWACSRTNPTFVIATYTGDPKHVAMVGVLGVPDDEESWSPRMRLYFKAVAQFHARPKDTPKGQLMVTNLSSFPSALTVIPVPDGDITKHREDFIVNENLKRLGCSGRSGMSLAAPAGATQAKFLQLYKTSDRIPLYGAVLELVKLCQFALTIFGKMGQEYADGMLCDVTEKALNDWWTEIGSDLFNTEPTDGILGPTTVAALLGLLIGARNRLNWYGAPVPKDTFEFEGLKRGLASFQKSQKITRSRVLDRYTLDKLHRATTKAAKAEGWAVPKAVKSTVAELSGKGGEMVMGMVGRDKAGIADIETLDYDRFVSLLHGERAKWLWYGKPRRNGGTEQFGRPGDYDVGHLKFQKDDQGGYMWTHSTAESPPVEEEQRKKEDSPQTVYETKPLGSATSVLESPNEKDPQLRKTVFKSVTGKMSDARSGFGRIKDAVGLRGHASKPSKDEGIVDVGYFNANNSSTTFGGGSTGTPISPVMVGKAFTWKDTPAQYQNGSPKVKVLSGALQQEPEAMIEEVRSDLPIVNIPEEEQNMMEDEARWAEQVREIRRDVVANDPSVAGSVFDDKDLEGPLLEALREPNNFEVLLHRRHSYSETFPVTRKIRNEAWWPRQMSFTDAEDAILGWEPIGTIADDGEDADTWAALHRQKLLSSDYKNLFEKITDLQDDIRPWVEQKVEGIEKLDEQASTDQEQFQTLYYQLTEQYQAVKQSSEDVLGDERAHVMEAIKDVEVLGAKLEYEINALVSKVRMLKMECCNMKDKSMIWRAVQMIWRNSLVRRAGLTGW